MRAHIDQMDSPGRIVLLIDNVNDAQNEGFSCLIFTLNRHFSYFDARGLPGALIEIVDPGFDGGA